MSWLKREIERGIGRGIGNAIGQAVGQAVKPAADRIAEKTITPRVNQAADTINQAAGQQPVQGQQATNNLTGALFNFKSAMMNVANEAAKNMKVCPSCGEPTTADKTFCPSCGAQLICDEQHEAFHILAFTGELFPEFRILRCDTPITFTCLTSSAKVATKCKKGSGGNVASVCTEGNCFYDVRGRADTSPDNK